MTALLFVHGAAGDARVWQPVLDALPPHLRASALTLTYFGDRPWPDEGAGFGTEWHARDILAAARALGEPVHLVCWSYGVHPGLAAMLDEPGHFASAFFYEAAMPHYIATAEGRRAFGEGFARFFGPVTSALEESGPEEAVRALLGPHERALAGGRRTIYLSNAAMMPLLFKPALAPRRIMPAQLAQIAQPCCAALGGKTAEVFSLSTRALAAALPAGELLVVEGADHFLPETDPLRFAALVADWVARNGR